MKLKEKENLSESLDNQSNVVALSDVDRAGDDDWLTPMNRLVKFVVTERDKFRNQIYLLAFTKIVNHTYCIELIEHFAFGNGGGQDIVQYVFAKEFCRKYKLVETVENDIGTF